MIGSNTSYDVTFETGTAPGTYIPKPIDLSHGSEYLELYGTGIRGLVGGVGAVTALKDLKPGHYMLWAIAVNDRGGSTQSYPVHIMIKTVK